MRLWHQELIDKLPRQQLLGQHRECCALRGKGWGKKHATVNYVFEYDPARLVAYHRLVIGEMLDRGYNPDQTWEHPDYRGKKIGFDQSFCDVDDVVEYYFSGIIYPEHNDEYSKECTDNLAEKECVCRYMEEVM